MTTQRSGWGQGYLRVSIVLSAVACVSVLMPLAPASAGSRVVDPGQATAGTDLGDRVIVGIRRGDRAEAADQVEDAGADILDYSSDGRYLVVDAPTGSEELADELEGTDSVRYVEPDVEVTAADLAPTDPRWYEMWGMQRIAAPAAWETTTGSKEIIVGVVDSGVDYTHEDLAASMWVNADEDPNTPGDDDGNGWQNDVHGADCANDDGDPMDDHSHGTHVAGTIGAVGNNDVGVAGVAWNIRIMALKFLGADNRGYMSDAVQCLYYAIDNGAHLTNHSWYGTHFSHALYDAIAEARDHNQLLIAAAGNESANNDAQPHYPASFDLENIISVAASDRGDALAAFSNYGGVSVDLAAPGVGIVSTVPGGYASYSGTSMAAPHVTGAAALLLAADPSLDDDARRLRDILLGSVDQVAALGDALATNGRLNAARALDSVVPKSPATIHIHDLIGGSVDLSRRNWKATITVMVTDVDEVASQGVKVAVRWNSGHTSSCITGIDGRCTTSSSKLSKTRKPVAFASIESVTAEGLTYVSAKDHTSDGDGAVSGLGFRVTRDQK